MGVIVVLLALLMAFGAFGAKEDVRFSQRVGVKVESSASKTETKVKYDVKGETDRVRIDIKLGN